MLRRVAGYQRHRHSEEAMTDKPHNLQAINVVPADDDLVELRESVDLENCADLHAVSGNFGEASWLMKQANAIRKRIFGPYDPNVLREKTHAALNPIGEEGAREP
jgi:hypothetical protein